VRRGVCRQPPRELQLEKRVQADVIDTYERFGCTVCSLSQPRASMQTPGIPDLYVFPPQNRPAFWHETKKPGGRQSPEQIVFQARCRAAGVAYVLGGVPEALAILAAFGFVAVLGEPT
jgi:hypothetical protein